MCNVMTFLRSAYEWRSEDDLTHAILEIFEKNGEVYGTRNIKVKFWVTDFLI